MQRFPVTGTWTPVAPVGNIVADVEFEMLVDQGGVLAVPAQSKIVVPVTVDGKIIGGKLGAVQLPSDTPDLNLNGPLHYLATFSNAYYVNEAERISKPITLPSIPFRASADATPIDLSAVSPSAGVVAAQLPTVASGGITDATGVGRALITAASATAARNTIDAACWLGPAASDAEMLALTGNPGDYCRRTDVGQFYYLEALPATTLSNWVTNITGLSAPVTEAELATAVQTDLNLAATALQSLSAGTDITVSGNQVALSSAAQTALAEAATALQSLTAGTDIAVSGNQVSLSGAAQTALGLANTALQSIVPGADISVTGNTVALSSAAQTALGLASTALQTSALAGLGTAILKDNGSSGFAAAISGTDYARPHRVNVLDFAGADPTGVADSTAAFNAAIAALNPLTGGMILAPSGIYKISSTLNFVQFQGLIGDGMGVTTINYTGTGPCINAQLTSNGGSPTGLPTPCAFEGFTVDGTSSGVGAVGLQIGNLFNSRGNDLCFQNFATAGGMGMLFKNYGALPVVNNMDWTRISLRYNTTGVVFDGGVSSGSTVGDFSYSNFQFSIIARTNQCGVTVQNGGNVGGGRFVLRGTFSSASSTNTGWVYGVDPAGSSAYYASSVTEMEFDSIVEYDGGLLGHKTLVMGGTLPVASFTGNGKLEFGDAPGYTFQGAVVPTGNIFAFEGRLVEPTLAAMTLNDCAVYQGGTQRVVWNNGGAQIPTSFIAYPQLGDVQKWKLQNGVTTITSFANAPYLASRTLEILIPQPASGAPGTIVWPSNVVWANGFSTLSTVNGAVDKVRMTYYPSESKWYAELLTNRAVNLESVFDSRYLGALPPTFCPADYSWISWAFDPLLAYSSSIPTAGDAFFTLLPIRAATTITNVILDVQTAGATLTAGQCFAGLFDHSGNLLAATADQSTNWQTAGLKVMPLATAQLVAAGLYYVGFFWNGTTGPKFSFNAATATANGANSGPSLRFAIDIAHTGLTTAFHTPASFTANATAFWAAVS